MSGFFKRNAAQKPQDRSDHPLALKFRKDLPAICELFWEPGDRLPEDHWEPGKVSVKIYEGDLIATVNCPENTSYAFWEVKTFASFWIDLDLAIRNGELKWKESKGNPPH